MINIKYFKNNMTNAGISLIIMIVVGGILAINNRELTSVIPASEWLFVATICLMFIFTFKTIKVPTNGIYYLHIFLLICLLTYSLLSSILSNNPQLSLQRVLLVYFLILVILLIVFSDIRPALTYSNIAFIMMLFGSIASLYSLTLKYTGNIEYTEEGSINITTILGVEFVQHIYGRGVLRFSAFFGNPNAFGFWLLLSITNTYYLILLFRKKVLFLWVLLFIQLYSLLDTGSRSAIISVVVALFFLWGYAKNKKKRKVIFCFSGILSLCLIPYLMIFLSNFRGNNEGLSSRGEAWNILFESTNNKPFFGEGFGLSFEEILQSTGLNFGAHNSYLALMSEIGVVGLILFLFFWFWGVILMLRYLSNIENGEYRLRMVGALAIVFALSLNQFFEASLMRFTFITAIGFYYLSVIIRGLHYGR